jgi:hypothetical protein
MDTSRSLRPDRLEPNIPEPLILSVNGEPANVECKLVPAPKLDGDDDNMDTVAARDVFINFMRSDNDKNWARSSKNNGSRNTACKYDSTAPRVCSKVRVCSFGGNNGNGRNLFRRAISDNYNTTMAK